MLPGWDVTNCRKITFYPGDGPVVDIPIRIKRSALSCPHSAKIAFECGHNPETQLPALVVGKWVYVKVPVIYNDKPTIVYFYNDPNAPDNINNVVVATRATYADSLYLRGWYGMYIDNVADTQAICAKVFSNYHRFHTPFFYYTENNTLGSTSPLEINWEIDPEGTGDPYAKTVRFTPWDWDQKNYLDTIPPDKNIWIEIATLFIDRSPENTGNLGDAIQLAFRLSSNITYTNSFSIEGRNEPENKLSYPGTISIVCGQDQYNATELGDNYLVGKASKISSDFTFTGTKPTGLYDSIYTEETDIEYTPDIIYPDSSTTDYLIPEGGIAKYNLSRRYLAFRGLGEEHPDISITEEQPPSESGSGQTTKIVLLGCAFTLHTELEAEEKELVALVAGFSFSTALEAEKTFSTKALINFQLQTSLEADTHQREGVIEEQYVLRSIIQVQVADIATISSGFSLQTKVQIKNKINRCLAVFGLNKCIYGFNRTPTSTIRNPELWEPAPCYFVFYQKEPNSEDSKIQIVQPHPITGEKWSRISIPLTLEPGWDLPTQNNYMDDISSKNSRLYARSSKTSKIKNVFNLKTSFAISGPVLGQIQNSFTFSGVISDKSELVQINKNLELVSRIRIGTAKNIYLNSLFELEPKFKVNTETVDFNALWVLKPDMKGYIAKNGKVNAQFRLKTNIIGSKAVQSKISSNLTIQTNLITNSIVFSRVKSKFLLGTGLKATTKKGGKISTILEFKNQTRAYSYLGFSINNPLNLKTSLVVHKDISLKAISGFQLQATIKSNSLKTIHLNQSWVLETKISITSLGQDQGDRFGYERWDL